MIEIRLVDAGGLAPYADGLRTLERDITYPIADGRDRFWIDHGPHYHPFFSALGDAHFLVALDRGTVVGTCAGVLRAARLGDRPIPSGYACDLKIARSHRGTGAARRMLVHGFREMLGTPHLRQWRYAYGAAMRSERGDVMNSARGLHPARLFRPHARLRLYFIPVHALANLDPSGCPPNPAVDGLDLSPTTHGFVSTHGTKDLRLVSTGAPWPLVHLTDGPRGWTTSLGHHLAHAARALPADALTCFAIDERLRAHHLWLAARGFASDTVSTIYGLSLVRGLRRAPWVHLATSEI